MIPLLVSMITMVTSTIPSAPPTVYYYDMDAAMKHVGEQPPLTYAEQASAFTFQGIMNSKTKATIHPQVMFNAGYANFDWPLSDPWWHDQLETADRVSFQNISSSTLCDLFVEADPSLKVNGLVIYESALPHGNGFTMPMALNLAAQYSLIPVTDKMLTKYSSCLSNYSIKYDLRIASMPIIMANRTSAWRWAIHTLLPKSSRTSVFNMYHYDPHYSSDPQSNATVANLDYAVSVKSFIIDLDPNNAEDVELLQIIFTKQTPLFDAFGWAYDEYAWTDLVSRGGGVVFCSFASPNLSFWALLALPPTSPGASSGKARRLPKGDSGNILDRSKYYITFETNEGDTPRIIVSAFGSSWASPQRGTIPVAWSVDPVLSERFPALMDFYAATATANDSFIGGVAGAGYVYLSRLTEIQLRAYSSRVGQLYSEYGPNVADTYGEANLSTMVKYSKYASMNGGAKPKAYVTQPQWGRNNSISKTAYKCPSLNMYIVESQSGEDRTPIICTATNLFYRNAGLHPSYPGKDLADRIRNVSQRYEPPFFITVYGGLNWQPGSTSGKTEFWSLLHSTVNALGTDFITIGADEMARLSTIACMNGTGSTCVRPKYETQGK